MKAQKSREIVLEVINEIGVLHNIAKTVSEKGINLLAVTTGAEGGRAFVRLVTDDHRRAMDILGQRDYHPLEAEVIVVDAPNRTGVLESLAGKLGREGINLVRIAATAGLGAENACVVLTTSDNDHALVVLNG